MPHLDKTGPENKGEKTGRGLGQCKSTSSTSKDFPLGKGMGKRRKSGGGQGLGQRIKSQNENQIRK